MAGPTGEAGIPVMPPIAQVLHGRMSISAAPLTDLEIRNLPTTTSTSAFTSTSNSATTSASTTPQIDSHMKLPSFSFNASKGSVEGSELEDDGQETDDTVIHYASDEMISHHTLKDSEYSPYRKPHGDVKDFEFDHDHDNTTHILEGNTRGCLTIEEITAGYVFTLKQSQLDLRNEIHMAFEEFKFDIITDHLSLPIESAYSRSLSVPYDEPDNFNETKKIYKNTRLFSTSSDRIGESVSFRLSDTAYLVLLHSIRPQLISFSIISFVRRRMSSLKKKTLLSLVILAVSILNMANNSSEGLKVYSKMLIYRTQRLTFALLKLERFLSVSANVKGAKKSNPTNNNNSRKTKMNLISSSIHLLISVFVKRIGKMITYIPNMGNLWKYIAVYGLDGDFDETKIVRNLIENPESCSCKWQNEPGRLIRALQYVRKILLCIVMSLMEIEDHEDKDNAKSILFMRKFWSKFGFENIKWNVGSPTLATRLLGMSTCLDEFNTFVDGMTQEIIEDDVQFSVNNDLNESLDESGESRAIGSSYGLDVVSEKNEDERIRQLSSMVGRVGYKLDLIELGMDSKDGIFTLRNDIDELVRCYDEVTSGKALRRNSSTTARSGELKKLRMSEILLDELSDDSDEKKKRSRRSSGINLKLFSVVRSNTDEKTAQSGHIEETETEEIVHLDTPSDEAGFRETLEKLCLGQGPKGAANSGAARGVEKSLPVRKTTADEDAFMKFRAELKQRLEEESL